MKKKSRFLQTPIEPFAVEPGLTADQVLARMERISFQGRNLATAHRIWQKMLQDDVTIFLGMAGALSAGGLRLIVAHLIRERYVDCLVSTGANLYHDLHETRGLADALPDGIAVGAAVHFAFGAPGGRPTASELRAALHELGFEVTELRHDPIEVPRATAVDVLTRLRQEHLGDPALGRDMGARLGRLHGGPEQATQRACSVVGAERRQLAKRLHLLRREQEGRVRTA